MEDIFTPIRDKKSLVLLVFLFFAGFIGNFLSMPLFFGVSLFFGSIATMLVIRIYGTFWGLLSAIIASSYISIQSHHPYAIIIFACEAIFVGLFIKRKNENLLLIDGIFWIFIGIPLVSLFYYGFLHTNLNQTIIIALLNLINGITNSLITLIIIMIITMPFWQGRFKFKETISLHQTLFILLVAFLLLPAMMIMYINVHYELKNIQNEIKKQITQESNQISNQIKVWHEQHIEALSVMAGLAEKSNFKPQADLQRFTENTKQLFPDMTRLHIDNAEGISIAFAQAAAENEKPFVGSNFSDRAYTQELKSTLKPVLSDIYIGRIGNPDPVVTMGVPIVSEGKYKGAVISTINLNYIENLLNISNEINAGWQRTIEDRSGQVIVSTNKNNKPMQKYNTNNKGQLRPMGNELYQLLNNGYDKDPEIVQWQKSSYFGEITIAKDIPWKLVLEIPFEPYQKDIEQLYINNLLLLIVLILIALILASYMSRRLANPISELSWITTNLPDKLYEKEKINWPSSNVAEIDNLTDNFQMMACTLQENFIELQATMMHASVENNKLEATIAAIGDGIAILNREYRILYENNIQKVIFGGHMGEYCYKAYAKRETECEKCPTRDAFANGEVNYQEWCAETENGDMYVAVTASPIKGLNGEVTSVIEVIRDITQSKLNEEALKEEKEFSENLILNSTVPTFVLNPEHKVITWNKAIEELTGMKAEDILGTDMHWQHFYDMQRPTLADLIIDGNYDDLYQLYKNFAKSNLLLDGLHGEGWFDKLKRGNRYLLFDAAPIHNSKGELIAVLETLQDMTKQKLAEQIVWEEKERAQVTLKSIGDAVITTDSMGNIIYMNPVAEELTGWINEEAKALPLNVVFEIINEETGHPVENPIEKCIQQGQVVALANHTVLVSKSGQKYAIEDSAAPIRSKENEIIGAVLVFHDVSEKRSMIQQIIFKAHHDSLTGLPNRILFNDRLTHSLTLVRRNKEKLAVMFFDLDKFKLVNDSLGHDMGDKLLKEVATRLKDYLRESDTIARLGGDEFTILLPKIKTEDDAIGVAKKVLDIFKAPFKVAEHEFHITASIGIALYPVDGEDAESLMKHADTAMYRAKEQGRNNYQLYTSSMNNKIMERIALENSMRQALNLNEFTLLYQPQVNIDTGKIVAMEALLRWQHPYCGIVSPSDFIPLAEESGLIIPLGQWVLKQACTQNKALQEAGLPPIRVTVNLSANQFRQQNLVEMVSEVLRETQLAPEWLELEITESAVIQDINYTIQILQDLRKMGVHIAIDDFGTGYSSLNYLKSFPIHTIKIDRSFITDINFNPQDTAIVSTIIVLAKNLNLTVVAEGVECEEQLAVLKDNKCSHMQGYFFSTPVPIKNIKTLLKGKDNFWIK